jgi:hypothetical protein
LGGSLNYARDVKKHQEKVVQERRNDPNYVPKKTIKKSAQPKAVANAGSKDINEWDMADTLTWLTSLNMQKYASKFAENEIIGAILLEIGLDDLDYMGIMVLAHRKVLLRGIEELKRGKNPNLPPAAPGGGIVNGGMVNGGMVNVGAEAKEAAPAKQGKHWSDVQPISQNVVNPGEEVYDEAAEAAAFRAAVSEWRNGGATSVSGEAAAQKGDKTIQIKHVPTVQTVHTAGAWVNPFGGGVGGGGDDDDFQSDLLSDDNRGPQTGGGGGKLFEGDYDEEREAAAFKAAVEQWRNPAAASARAGGVAKGEEGVGGDTAVATSHNVAEDLAKKMEEDFAAKRAEMEERRLKAEEDMKERLAKKERELEEIYRNKENELDELDKENFEYRSEEKGGGGAKEEFGGWEKGRGEEKESNYETLDNEASVSEPKVDMASPRRNIDVGVELLETEAWSPDAKETGGFVVEESDDEDE